MPRRTTPPPTPSTDDPPDDGTQTDLAKAVIEVFNPDFETLNLQQKIARITGMIGGVQKRGFNPFHKYHYVLEADLTSAVRQYLAAAGIIIVPNAHKWEFHNEICVVDIEYTVTDGKEAFTFSMPGAGADRGDKGLYKAITGSQKYALMKLFKIETGDDPEGDTRVDERAHVQDAKPERPPVVTSGTRAGVKRGGHTELASPIQIRQIAQAQKDLAMPREDFLLLLQDVVGSAPVINEGDNAGEVILHFLQALSTENAGKIIGKLVVVTQRIEDAMAEDNEPSYA